MTHLKIIQTLHFLGCLPLFHSFILKYFFPHLALTDSKLPNRYCHIARSSKKLTYEWANYATRNFTIFCSFFSALKREKTSIFQSLEKTNSYQKGLWSYFTHLWKKILDRYREKSTDLIAPVDMYLISEKSIWKKSSSTNWIFSLFGTWFLLPV